MAEAESKHGIHTVRGYAFPPFLTEEWLERASSEFKPRDSDIFVISTPKSGTHWLTYIVYMLVKKEKLSKPLVNGATTFFEMPQVDAIDPEMKGKMTIMDMSKFRVTKDAISALPDPRFFFSHFPYVNLPKNPATRYIYIYRNPKDIVLSLYHHFSVIKEEIFKGTFDDFFKFYIEHNCMNYCEHIKEYINHKDEPNLFILSYEELHLQFKAKVEEIATFLGVELSEELFELIVTETKFENMRENELVNEAIIVKEGTRFFPKGKVGNWKDSLSKEQSKKIDEILLARLGEDFVKKHITFS